jgi:uncharacterized membrane protein
MNNRQDSSNSSKQQIWLSIVIGFSIFVLILLDTLFHVPLKFVLPILVIGIWIYGAVIIWQRANAKPKQDAWWQDDSCSGWRGY